MKKLISITMILILSLAAISANAATMFALDGRAQWVPDDQAWAWRNVGWYTADDIYTGIVQPNYNAFKAQKDYLNLMNLVDQYLPFLYGTVHEQSMYAIRTEAMDSWRAATNSNVGISSYEFKDGKLTVVAANISYKDIDSFELSCTGYGADNTTYWTIRCGELSVAEFSGYTSGTLEGTNSITAPRVTKVVFTDGTVWYGK